MVREPTEQTYRIHFLRAAELFRVFRADSLRDRKAAPFQLDAKARSV